MKKLILSLMLLFVFSSVSCAMENITTPISQIIIQDPRETTIYTNNWTNDDAAVQFRLSWLGFLIRITNNTEDPMLLIWNKSAFVDVNGESHRLMPGETRMIHAAQAIPETMIPPHTSYAPMAVAEGYYAKSTADYKFILDYPVNIGFFGLIGLKKTSSKDYKIFAQKYKGREIGLILCLNIRGEDNYFKFNMPLEFDKELDSLPEIDAEGNIVEDKNIPIGITLQEATVIEVKENSVAAKAGINTGDVILEINAKPVADITDLHKYIESRYNDGRTVMVLCQRGTDKSMITLKK